MQNFRMGLFLLGGVIPGALQLLKKYMEKASKCRAQVSCCIFLYYLEILDEAGFGCQPDIIYRRFPWRKKINQKRIAMR